MTRVQNALICAALFICSSMGHASDIAWTRTCVKLRAVDNFAAYAGQFVLVFTPAVPHCNGGVSGVAGAIPFVVGQDGVTDSNFDSLLESALAAYKSGHQVTIAYDQSTQACYGMAIAVGGASGNCP